MTVHAIEIRCSTAQDSNPANVPAPKPPELANVLPDRVQQNVFDTLTEVLPEQAHPAGRTGTDGLGAVYLRGLYRADFSHSKEEVLDQFENGVVADAKWYEIRYHECDADAENSQGCPEWTVERSSGSIPSGVV